ncbi:hypothetical protein [Aromatoleum diolicum]|uniref:DUF4062 domain-containing protein n=1 Tax=Aromatoleum diolicum TaxID=75796 RepID=A0ABX1QEQ1_9RHOO|nr:hypothetical protein [Aromatoleum diolicum]NMG76773.1 hypothetical protein [Aromatoleum diolicum]
MQTKRIFLASSAELKADRDQFEILIGRKNKDWNAKGVFLELVMWEDFLDAMSQTRLQDQYNKAIAESDIFVMLFWTKVGKYTAEEFEHAFTQFKATNKPFVFTYFKNAPGSSSRNREDLTSLWVFQDKLKALGHFQTEYQNVESLLLHFTSQLDKLVANGFIEFGPDDGEPGGNRYSVTLTGNGATVQGAGATAVGTGGVQIGGSNTGSINTGTQVNTAGGAYVGGNVHAGGDFVGGNKIIYGTLPADLEPLFATLLAAVARRAPADKRTAAVQQVQELKAEAAKGKDADDGKLGRIIDGLTGMVPGAIGAVVSMFATPILGGIAGPVTKFVLERLKPD